MEFWKHHQKLNYVQVDNVNMSFYSIFGKNHTMKED